MIDYMVMEAIAVKVGKEDEKADTKAKKQNWKRDKSGFDKLREAAGGG